MARPVYTAEQVEEGRRRLCEAALKLYRESGYDAVTLREIGAAAGVSSATPYRFFDSKEALFTQVRAVVYAQFGEYLQAADPKRGDPLIRLRRVALAMVEFGLKFPDDYRLIFSMRQPPMAKDSLLYLTRAKTLEHVIPICQQIIDSGRMNGDARTQMHVAWASLHGLISFHVSNQLNLGCTIEELVNPMLDRLFAPTPAPRASRRAAVLPADKTKNRPKPAARPAQKVAAKKSTAKSR